MKKLVAGLFAMVAMGSLSVGCVAQPDVEVEEDGESRAKDPLGVDLKSVGLSAGDRPCGDYAHVASVVSEEGRYLAFCAGAARDTSVVQVTPGGVAPIGSSGGCALDTYLAATPDDAAVPQELVDACEPSSLGTRLVSAGPMVVGVFDPAGPILDPNNDCSNASLFENIRCDAIDDYTGNASVKDFVSWCGLGPYSGNAQRTASTQGLPTAYVGRMTVAACGSATTNVKGWVKRTSGTWVNTPGDNINVSPFHVVTIDVHHYDVTDGAGLPDGVDMRFTVTPSAGASYRYTGAFVEYFPVP
jgi:hypothetical protein